MTFIQENGVPRGKLQLLGFFHFFDIKCQLWMKLAPALIPLEDLVLVYVVLRPIICKTVSQISDIVNRTNSIHN